MAKTIRAHWFSAVCLLICAALVLGATAAPQRKGARRPVATKKKAAQKPPLPKGNDLSSLVRTYRQAPTPARRAAVESYAAAHPKEASLADLALGVASYEQKNYADAIARLQKLPVKLPQIADYAAYYLAAARLEAQQPAAVAKDVAPVRATELPSPLAGKSWLLEARALKTSAPADAVRTLREHYTVLPQPEGDVTLADCYQAANDLPNAADFYQRVYFQYTTGDAAARAAAALLALKDAMSAAYPTPPAAQALHHADRLLQTGEYSAARTEYQSLLDRAASPERDQARVRIGVADYLHGSIPAAKGYLHGLELPEGDADAERLYYLEECARKSNDVEEMLANVKRLSEHYPKSQWRLKALLSAANRFLIANRADEFLPLYRVCYRDFPGDSSAGLCHWKVTFQAYLRNEGDTDDLLREHLKDFPSHPTTGAALYFLGRHAEQESDFAAARAYYQKLSKTFENQYYALQARQRLLRPEVQSAVPAGKAVAFLGELNLPAAKPVVTEPSHATIVRIERSRYLRAAGLVDLADSELRFAAKRDAQPQLIGMEMASVADAPHLSVRIMKNMAPEYLSLPLEDAPRKYWELLFPLPYRSELMADAQSQGVDPFLVAGLIRQESEFNPQAVSRANAFGLTQVRPGTGRQFAKRAGIARFSNSTLFQPAANLKIGTMILRSMLDQNGGRVEQTLASYNAGPQRLVEWAAWNTYREPAEFVESIPFTETRDYVQAVMRNADIYRRLYQ